VRSVDLGEVPEAEEQQAAALVRLGAPRLLELHLEDDVEGPAVEQTCGAVLELQILEPGFHFLHRREVVGIDHDVGDRVTVAVGVVRHLDVLEAFTELEPVDVVGFLTCQTGVQRPADALLEPGLSPNFLDGLAFDLAPGSPNCLRYASFTNSYR